MGRPPIGKEAMSAAERVRRHRARLRERREKAQPATASAGRLEAQNAALRAENAALVAALAELRKARPEAAEIAKLRHSLAAAKLTIAAMHEEEKEHDGKLARARGMDVSTVRAISKVLHPDTRRDATEAQKDDALRKLNAWRDDSRKTRR